MIFAYKIFSFILQHICILIPICCIQPSGGIMRIIFSKKLRRSISYFEFNGSSSSAGRRSSTEDDKQSETEKSKLFQGSETEKMKTSQPSDKLLEVSIINEIY